MAQFLHADKIVDARGAQCPGPLVELIRALKGSACRRCRGSLDARAAHERRCEGMVSAVRARVSRCLPCRGLRAGFGAPNEITLRIAFNLSAAAS
jgi:hypothetical protein